MVYIPVLPTLVSADKGTDGVIPQLNLGRRNPMLASIKAIAKELTNKASSLITDVVQDGFESYKIVAKNELYNQLMDLTYATNQLVYVVESWDPSQCEVKAHNLCLYVKRAWDIATKYASVEASDVRNAIRRIIEYYQIPMEV